MLYVSVDVLERKESRDTRKDGDDIPVLTPIVPLHDQLMRSRDEGEPVVVVECFTDVLSKSVSCTTRTDSPSASVIGITPEQIAHGTFVWDLLNPVERTYVLKSVDTRRKASVQTKDLVLNQCGQREVVEEVGKEFPDIGIAVFAQTLVVEAIDLSDLAGFVVAAENGYALRVADFESDEQSDGLDGKVATVDVVAYDRQYEGL